MMQRSARPQKVVILGSTGSIGQQTLSVLAQHEALFEPYVLVAHQRVELMLKQCIEFQPAHAVMTCSASAQQLKERLIELGHKATQVHAGAQAAIEWARDGAVDVVVAAIVGGAGLPSTFAAVQAGKRVLLANKEALVMAGSLLMQTVVKQKAVLLPVDSEHNALFQSMPTGFLPGQPLPNAIDELILTASGGPFRTLPLNEFDGITPAMAVAHPNWSMGQKISVDSATMMNKVLEVLEAHFLFSAPASAIRVVLHPQSIVHSLVRYRDGSLLSQMGEPDMRIPIAHTLGWPERSTASGANHLDLTRMDPLVFEPLCEKRFPCFKFASSCLEQQQDSMLVLNAANEIAVEAFLQGDIAYGAIYQLIDSVLQEHPFTTLTCLDSILEQDAAVRRVARAQLTALKARSI